MKKLQLPTRWKWVLAIWMILALPLVGIPLIGISTLNYQANVECSVLVDGQQVMLRGRDCDKY